MTAARVQKLELCERADTLGDHPQTQTFGQRNNGLGDRCVARVGLEVGDEGNIDLEGVDGEVLEVRQTRIARTEIVDRDREALLAQMLENLLDRVQIV